MMRQTKPATATQVSLARALDAEPPTYVHVPLLCDTNGERMAKRKGSLTLASLRDRGVPPERVVGVLARSLGILPDRIEATAGELTDRFSLDALAREPYRLRAEDLAFLGLDGPA